MRRGSDVRTRHFRQGSDGLGGHDREARESAPFHFESVWRANADPAAVWETLVDIDSWPQWWPGIASACLLDPRTPSDPGLGPGSRARLDVRSLAGIGLRFGLEVQVEQPGRGMTVTADGDLTGVGQWSLSADGPVTTVSIVWCVTTRRRLIRLLRPLAGLTHGRVMAAGNAGLNRRLSQRAR
ncbi:polyketide cyclase/dehydrase/lipid transport protein [Brevibacterium sanguinis]|uniref:Polyketide cyclase/dehydrase/lipid transport protein n=2 Tax=Brevibacterium TaxID=1696 RepID=A0A366INE2_9MICO|nr:MULTISPECIES: SRPBCC family protein [Brevibacterium]RBP66218.1 polyketide cyclase/dehydrase/lipid transport protein [Brevibacterium sanguinis]RBP72869.1 polyketide cyclase/dehydrase/lipid transport protein [Brevibacterium celere]